jgi:FtsH-binding integral membrane protein
VTIEAGMTSLSLLWVPLLASAVLVFVASSIIHMLTPWHKGDYPNVPDEDKLVNVLRPLAIPPGDYMVPGCADMKEMRTPEFAEKGNKGPVMVMTVMPSGPISMSGNLVQWFVYSIVVSFFAAYVASRALPAGAPHAQVFRLVGVTAFAGYALALWQMSIWYRRAWGTTIRATIDGLIYALLTAGTFRWLWPR